MGGWVGRVIVYVGGRVDKSRVISEQMEESSRLVNVLKG